MRTVSARHVTRPLLAAAVSILAAAFACSGNPEVTGRGAGSTQIGTPDRSQNGLISVDEPKLSGNIEDGTLRIDVPVTVVATHDVAGTIHVRLQNVDGTTVYEEVAIDFALTAGESTVLSADLSAPENVTAQADLVQYNVRVDDGSSEGLRVTKSLLYVVPLVDVRLEGPKNVRKGKSASYRVSARHAVTQAPIPDFPVELDMTSNGTVVQHKTGTTGVTGDAVFPLDDAEIGQFRLEARAKTQGSDVLVDDDLNIEGDTPKLLLTTDKPIYQPGQVIYLRALALNRGANTPLAGEAVTFEVLDGKGNKIFKKELSTDDYGVAATKFQLGPILNQGSFKVRVIDGDRTTEKSVEVSRYSLPKFDVAVQTEAPWYRPGDLVQGTIDARYFFGKNVGGGTVLIEAATLDVGETVFQQVMGDLDADGHYAFSVTLPSVLAGLPLEQGNAAVLLRVTVTDTAGQAVTKSSLVTVSEQGASIVLVPEATQVVPGIENQFLLFLSDPLGNPIAGADVTITTASGETLAATSDEFGQATLSWTPPSDAQQTLQASITTANGDVMNQTFWFMAQAGGEHVVLRTDKSVYETGEVVNVDVYTSPTTSYVYVDWLNDGQAVGMQSLQAVDGHATFTMTVDPTLAGSNRVEAYVVDEDGNIVRTGRTLFVRGDSSLSVELSADQPEYEPGTPAKLTFDVKDENGEPKVAALGVQIVDQAVFGLIDAQPGLLRTYFELEDELATPDYEIAGPNANFSNLLFVDTSGTDEQKVGAAQRRTEGALAALGGKGVTGIQKASAGTALARAREIVTPNFDAARTEITPEVTSAMKSVRDQLKSAGCDSFGDICTSLDKTFETALQDGAAANIRAYDFWGNTYEITVPSYSNYVQFKSLGPDERNGTADDQSFMVTFDLGSQYPSSSDGDGLLTPGVGNGTGGTTSASFGGSGGGLNVAGGGGESESGPRVRQDFPETLYVNPLVITGSDGKATIDVDMADSITEWRVSTMASSADGKLGGAESGIKVFQDFFVDVNFPATLTRGDEVTFPIVVYNYLDVPQTVNLELAAGSWYTALGATTTSVDLEPGQVLGVSFPVRVEEVGLKTLTVTGIGTKKSDAVARTVRVLPDGKAFPLAQSGTLAAGDTTYAVDFPAEAVTGSAELHLDVFPAFVSQVVQGMDSLLQEPTGCFEQTTSSAWPNVLVTAYMIDTQQITPDIQLKAESLMSIGYQRLLTFEHTGGGYSWFGETDPAPNVSVTAFGVLEFSDMAKVHTVDEAMLERTTTWLASQQQADGSWTGDQTEFFSFNTSVLRNSAFVVWSLASAGYTGAALDSGIAYLKANLAISTEDPFTLAVAANALLLAAPGDSMIGDILSELEARKQTDTNGTFWDTEGTATNFYGTGQDGAVATTGLVAYALLLDGTHTSTVDSTLKYLTAQKDQLGNFGSTQATIWTLRALVLAAKKGTAGAVGALEVYVDDVLRNTVNLTEAQSDVMTTVDLSAYATTGAHDVKLSFSGTGKPSVNLVSNHYLPWSLVPAEPTGPLSIDIAYDRTSLAVNESVAATVTITNNTASTENMVLVTLGLPPGFELVTSDLDAYVSAGTLSRYDVTGKQIILYLTQIAPAATATFTYHLVASMPVDTVDGGGEVKRYYEPDVRAMSAAKSLKVTN